MGKQTEELYHGYQNVGTSKHGSVRLRLIVRQIVRLSVRLRRVHKALLPGWYSYEALENIFCIH